MRWVNAEMTEQEKAMILLRIEGLQQSRAYADEVESQRYSVQIERLLKLLDVTPVDAAGARAVLSGDGRGRARRLARHAHRPHYARAAQGDVRG